MQPCAALVYRNLVKSCAQNIDDLKLAQCCLMSVMQFVRVTCISEKRPATISRTAEATDTCAAARCF